MRREKLGLFVILLGKTLRGCLQKVKKTLKRPGTIPAIKIDQILVHQLKDGYHVVQSTLSISHLRI